jgi:hypothetical protein
MELGREAYNTTIAQLNSSFNEQNLLWNTKQHQLLSQISVCHMQLNSSFMQMSSASLLIEQLRTSVNNTITKLKILESEHHSAINQRISDEKVTVRMQSDIESCVLAVDECTTNILMTQKNLEIALQNNTDTFKNLLKAC